MTKREAESIGEGVDERVARALELLLERLMPRINSIEKNIISLQEELIETKKQIELVITHINDRATTLQDTVGKARGIDLADDENAQDTGCRVYHPDGTVTKYPS